MKIFAAIVNADGPKLYVPQLTEKLQRYSGDIAFDINNIKYKSTDFKPMAKIQVIAETRRKLALMCKSREAFLAIEEVDVDL